MSRVFAGQQARLKGQVVSGNVRASRDPSRTFLTPTAHARSSGQHLPMGRGAGASLRHLRPLAGLVLRPHPGPVPRPPGTAGVGTVLRALRASGAEPLSTRAEFALPRRRGSCVGRGLC